MRPIKVIGKMKDKSEIEIIDEFVGLKSKMYPMKNIDGKESNTAKGVNFETEFNEFMSLSPQWLCGMLHLYYAPCLAC